MTVLFLYAYAPSGYFMNYKNSFECFTYGFWCILLLTFILKTLVMLKRKSLMILTVQAYSSFRCSYKNNKTFGELKIILRFTSFQDDYYINLFRFFSYLDTLCTYMNDTEYRISDVVTIRYKYLECHTYDFHFCKDWPLK